MTTIRIVHWYPPKSAQYLCGVSRDLIHENQDAPTVVGCVVCERRKSLAVVEVVS